MLAYSGKGAFIMRNLNVSDIIEENSNMFKAMVSKAIKLNLDLIREVPEIRADPREIQELVVNLISNASEAIGKSLVT